MISAAQIRAARALLGISASELASRANVGLATIQRFETQEGVPISRSATLPRIQKALEDAGVVFLGDPINSPGVQLQHRPRQLRTATEK